MISTLIVVLVVLVVAGLLIWAVDQIAASLPLPAPIPVIIKVIIVLCVCLWLLDRFVPGAMRL